MPPDIPYGLYAFYDATIKSTEDQINSRTRLRKFLETPCAVCHLITVTAGVEKTLVLSMLIAAIFGFANSNVQAPCNTFPENDYDIKLKCRTLGHHHVQGHHFEIGCALRRQLFMHVPRLLKVYSENSVTQE